MYRSSDSLEWRRLIAPLVEPGTVKVTCATCDRIYIRLIDDVPTGVAWYCPTCNEIEEVE